MGRMTSSRLALVALALAAALASVSAAAAAPRAGFVLTSPVVKPGGRIPVAHTCDGAGARIPLRWSGAPKGTRGFALVIDDPDAALTNFLRPDESVEEPFVHLIGWEIKGAARSLAGKAPVEGRNDDGKRGWTAPCPQDGEHTFRFRLYALRAPLGLKPTADHAAFEAALSGKVLGTAKLTGRYGG